MRRVWLTLIAVGLLANNQGICSLRGSLQIGKVLQQSDDVVVATSVQDPANPGLLKLLIARTIKGDMLPGSAVKVSLPVDSSPGTVINSVSMSSMGQKTGLWFIRQSDSAWFLIPLFTGTVLPSDFYIPVSSGDLASPFAYTADLDPRKS